MTANRMRPSGLAILVVAAAAGFSPGSAQAQWGGGGGFGGGGFGYGGFGFGLFSPAPSPTAFINQHSMIAAQRGSQAPTMNPYAGNPNSYINKLRDNGFVSRYDVDRRSPTNYRGGLPVPIAAEPSAVRRGSAPAAPPARAVQPLANFYSPDHRLVWPANAPEAALKDKRSAADTAAAVVFSESRQSGVASIASVTDARQKLIDYGRPALDEIRARDSAVMVESFHTFLLSLYDSLALAATPSLAAAK